MKNAIIILLSSVFVGIIALLTLSNVDQKTDNEAIVNSPPSPCSGGALCVTDQVTRIVDGDTIYTKNYRIRLSLTNTPERNQVGFAEATAFTQSLCPVGSTILIDQDDGQRTDSYGRMVAKVICNGTNLNAELLENNHAHILEQYCAKSEFSSEPWAKKFGC